MPVEDFKTRRGQEYRPCDLLEGKSKISVSSSIEMVSSKKNKLDELLAERYTLKIVIISRRYRCRKCLTHRGVEIIEHIRKRYNRLASSFISADELINPNPSFSDIFI